MQLVARDTNGSGLSSPTLWFFLISLTVFTLPTNREESVQHYGDGVEHSARARVGRGAEAQDTRRNANT